MPPTSAVITSPDGDVDDAHAHVVVDEGDPTAVRRPGRLPRHLRHADRQPPRLAQAVLGRDLKLVTVAGVREPRDLAAVRRPHRSPVRRPGAAGQIAGAALLDRDRENLAPGLEKRPLSPSPKASPSAPGSPTPSQRGSAQGKSPRTVISSRVTSPHCRGPAGEDNRRARRSTCRRDRRAT